LSSFPSGWHAADPLVSYAILVLRQSIDPHHPAGTSSSTTLTFKRDAGGSLGCVLIQTGTAEMGGDQCSRLWRADGRNGPASAAWWGDAVTLWRDCIAKSPLKPRPYNNLGVPIEKKDGWPNRNPFSKARLQQNMAMLQPGHVMIQSGRMEEGIINPERSLNKTIAHNNAGLASGGYRGHPPFQGSPAWLLDHPQQLGVALAPGDLEGAA
jgi:hypothetical protein